MKKTASLLIVLFFLGNAVFAGSKEKITIKTSAQCGMCKTSITSALKNTEGVKKVKMDLPSKTVTVLYDSGKTSPEKIRSAISMAGYDADEVKADPAAYNKLHECCKKPQ